MSDFTVVKLGGNGAGTSSYFKIESKDGKQASIVYQSIVPVYGYGYKSYYEEISWENICCCGANYCLTPYWMYKHNEEIRKKGISDLTAYLRSLFKEPVDLHQFL